MKSLSERLTDVRRWVRRRRALRLTRKWRAKSFNDYLIDVLQSRHIGLTTVILVAEAMAEDARFNIWFVDNVKTSDNASDEEAMHFIDGSDDLTARCIFAIKQFHRDHDLSKLHAALTEFKEQIVSLIEKPFSA